MKYGIIYKITNKINGKIYIGKTVQQFKRRCRPQAYKSCTALYNSIQVHGWDNFEKEEFISALSENHLASLEEATIKLFDCMAPKGYNIISIDNGLNRYTDETKKKLSISRKNYIASLETPIIPANRKVFIQINGIDHRECNVCKHMKPIDTFARTKSRWDGRAVVCKKCHQDKYNSKQDRRVLTEDQVAESYKTRNAAMRAGVKKSYENNPELKKQKSLQMSKPIIATHIITGEVLEFSAALAAKQAGFQNSNIGVAIKNNTVYKKYTWRFK